MGKGVNKHLQFMCVFPRGIHMELWDAAIVLPPVPGKGECLFKFVLSRIAKYLFYKGGFVFQGTIFYLFLP